MPVPLEADGLDVGVLEGALADGPIEFVHVIPNAHNPAGCTLSVEKRRRLVDLATEHDFFIFEDDPYREFPSRASRWRRCSRWIRRQGDPRVVVLEDGRPGVRVGYLVGPTEEIAKLSKHANEQYISPNMLAESVVLELCKSGVLDENITFVKGELKARCDALVDALREKIPRGVRRPPGRLLPLARPRLGHRHQGAAGGRQRARESPSSPVPSP